jgi:hypothetical protein
VPLKVGNYLSDRRRRRTAREDSFNFSRRETSDLADGWVRNYMDGWMNNWIGNRLNYDDVHETLANPDAG